jgi:hypothetical protein
MTHDVLMLDGQDGKPAKVSYTARRLLAAVGGATRATRLAEPEACGRPRSGDLLLARVDSVGQHKFLGQDHGRRSQLFAGDLIVVAYGARYSPDQFEAVVPDDLGPCDLAAGGGIAARVLSSHGRMLPPTRLTPLGLLADDAGQVINLRDLALPAARRLAEPRPRTLAVLGTSMNAGKTTIAASLVCGLNRSGLRVGAAKVTGTGAPADPTMFADAGAARVLDFTDLGYASTYQLDTATVATILRDLVAHLAAEDVDAIVLEVADGVLQRETEALLATDTFRGCVDGVVFAAADSMGAVSGARLVAAHGVPVVALGGVVTASPLAMGEAARCAERPLHTSADFRDPSVAYGVLAATAVAGGVTTRALAAPRDAARWEQSAASSERDAARSAQAASTPPSPTAVVA